jgi:hypothetical protein
MAPGRRSGIQRQPGALPRADNQGLRQGHQDDTQGVGIMPEWMVSILPSVMVVESVLAGILYLWYGQWAHAGYWMSAAVLTTFVILMKG